MARKYDPMMPVSVSIAGGHIDIGHRLCAPIKDGPTGARPATATGREVGTRVCESTCGHVRLVSQLASPFFFRTQVLELSERE
jgi:hypothetical protein